MYLNPWDTERIISGGNVDYITTPYNVGINQSGAPSSALQVNGNVSATQYEGLGVLPIGGIIMWSGFEPDIPDGFELCDGGVHGGVTTPNLVNRFIRGSTLPGNWHNRRPRPKNFYNHKL